MLALRRRSQFRGGRSFRLRQQAILCLRGPLGVDKTNDERTDYMDNHPSIADVGSRIRVVRFTLCRVSPCESRLAVEKVQSRCDNRVIKCVLGHRHQSARCRQPESHVMRFHDTVDLDLALLGSFEYGARADKRTVFGFDDFRVAVGVGMSPRRPRLSNVSNESRQIDELLDERGMASDV